MPPHNPEKRRPHPATVVQAKGAAGMASKARSLPSPHPATRASAGASAGAGAGAAVHAATLQPRLRQHSGRGADSPQTVQRAESATDPVEISQHIVAAYNAALEEFYTTRLKRSRIRKLADLEDITSNPEIDCNFLGGSLLASLIEACRGTHISDSRSFPSKNAVVTAIDDGTLGKLLCKGSFVNFSLQGEPSALNHVFSLYSWNKCVLLQAYVSRQVTIRPTFPLEEFLGSLKVLATDKTNWTDAYEELFDVAPSEVANGLTPESWLRTLEVTALRPK
jgi:hypothetical protein